MEFAEWVVSGLDQLRAGQLPGGQGLYEAVSSGLGSSAAVDAYMNTGDAAARAELVQTIAQAVAANPAFEQQLRQAADNAQSAGQGVGGDGAKPSFFKTTNGMVVAVALAVAVVGGGIGLGVGLSGDSGSGLAGLLKGTWTCKGAGGAGGTITIGDGTWSLGEDSGTWKQDGSKVTVTNKAHAGDNLVGTNLPSGAGPFDISVGAAGNGPAQTVHVKGTVSAHSLTLSATAQDSEISPTITCTK